MAVAVEQHHGFKSLNQSPRCRLQSFTDLDYSFVELTQAATLAHSITQAFEVASIHKSISTPCLSLAATNVEDEFHTIPKIEILGGQKAPRVHALVVEAAIGIASGHEPIPVLHGLGGAYFIHNQKRDVIAIAKPIDEEPLAFNNPKGFGGMKRSIRVGETSIRELAAYLLDHGAFAGVPPTALVKISHVAFHINEADAVSATPCKLASLQRFVAHDFDAGELGCSGFSVASIHRIGILDIRLLNLDRHAGNILVKKQAPQENLVVGAAELVPIDHGLCLPEWLDDPYFEWIHWPQAAVPFSELELEYISNLDPFKDAELLRAEIPDIRESSIRVLILCTIFLKGAAAAGLCLADIAEMMTREFSGGQEKPSMLEVLCAKAKSNVIDSFSEENDDEEDIGMFQFDSESEEHFEETTKPPRPSQPPKVPRMSQATSMPLLSHAPSSSSPMYDETEKDGNDHGADTVREKEDERQNHNGLHEDGKIGNLMRSSSFSEQKHNGECKGVSFDDLSEGEWDLFLKIFDKLLPEDLEGTNFMIYSQHRLGTSCEF